MDKSTNLGTKPIGRLLLSLAIPAITAQMINALYNLVDRMYIGRIPVEGPLALGGLGVAFPVIMIISAFAALVGMGGAPQAAIKLGEGKRDEAEKILGNAFVCICLVSAILMVVFFAFKEPILTMFGATENILPYANDYFTIYLLGTFFVQVSLGLNAFITTQGFSKISMMTVLVGAISNIILDPILIFGFDMGVKGAAYATVISQFISAVWVLKFLFGERTIIRIKKEYFKLDKALVVPMLALGLAPFIMQSTESLVQLTLNAGMKRYGGLQADNLISSLSIIVSTMQFMTMPATGLTQGAQPIISYNYGAGNIDRVKKTYKILVLCCFAYTTFAWVLAMFIPQMFVYIFSNDKALIALSVRYMGIFMSGTFMLGMQYASQAALVALGQAKISMFLAMLRKIVLLIPLALLFPMFMGYEGIFYAEPVADVIASITTMIVFYFYSRRLFHAKTNEKQVA